MRGRHNSHKITFITTAIFLYLLRASQQTSLKAPGQWADANISFRDMLRLDCFFPRLPLPLARKIFALSHFNIPRDILALSSCRRIMIICDASSNDAYLPWVILLKFPAKKCKIRRARHMATGSDRYACARLTVYGVIDDDWYDAFIVMLLYNVSSNYVTTIIVLKARRRFVFWCHSRRPVHFRYRLKVLCLRAMETGGPQNSFMKYSTICATPHLISSAVIVEVSRPPLLICRRPTMPLHFNWPVLMPAVSSIIFAIFIRYLYTIELLTFTLQWLPRISLTFRNYFCDQWPRPFNDAAGQRFIAYCFCILHVLKS